jgi:hypothetical protein
MLLLALFELTFLAGLVVSCGSRWLISKKLAGGLSAPSLATAPWFLPIRLSDLFADADLSRGSREVVRTLLAEGDGGGLALESQVRPACESCASGECRMSFPYHSMGGNGSRQLALACGRTLGKSPRGHSESPPNWAASVNGVKAAVFGAYGGFQALEIPSGDHFVEMRYDKPWLCRGAPMGFWQGVTA